MSQTVVGLYDDHSTAKNVIDKLTDQGVSRSDVHVERQGDSSGAFGSDLTTGLSKRGVPDDEARFYADGVSQGGTLVVLDVEKSRARDVAALMEKHGSRQMKDRSTGGRTDGDADTIGRGEHRHNEAVDFSDHDKDYRKHYKSHYGEDDYDAHEPAYRLGHAYGSDTRYADREYSDVEPEMRRRYEERHGKGTWQKAKDAVKHAFSSSSDRHRTARRS